MTVRTGSVLSSPDETSHSSAAPKLASTTSWPPLAPVVPGTKLYCFGEKGHRSATRLRSLQTSDCSSQLCRLPLSLHRHSDMFISSSVYAMISMISGLSALSALKQFQRPAQSSRGQVTYPFCPPRHRCLYPGPPHRPGDSMCLSNGNSVEQC